LILPLSQIRLSVLVLMTLFVCLTVPAARADVTILLEEPYSYDGAFAGTGHTAVYLTRICAASPTQLRRCKPGEPGVVISRYHNVGDHDWIAIPLIPYLYAVEKPEDIPLFADTKLEAALRDHYRRKYLESVAPDTEEGTTPAGNWYELIGSAYDRTLYAFQIETTPEKDDEFIAHYNSAANDESYKVVTRNCADFVRDAVNFYYPKAVGRSILSDFYVATPKHDAKALVKYSHRHSDLHFSAYVIPQIPGTIKRSKPIHGLVDSIFKAKKYEIPLLVWNPFVGGGVALDYLISGRFDPAHNAMIFGPDGSLDRPMTEEERRNHHKALQEILSSEPKTKNGAERSGKSWREFREIAQLRFDSAGRPVLQGMVDGNMLEVGLVRGNFLSSSAPQTLTRELLVTRLREELRRSGPPKASDLQLSSDLSLLQRLNSITAGNSSEQTPLSAAVSHRGGTR
jgi:hypothetical protein